MSTANTSKLAGRPSLKANTASSPFTQVQVSSLPSTVESHLSVGCHHHLAAVGGRQQIDSPLRCGCGRRRRRYRRGMVQGRRLSRGVDPVVPMEEEGGKRLAAISGPRALRRGTEQAPPPGRLPPRRQRQPCARTMRSHARRDWSAGIPRRLQRTHRSRCGALHQLLHRCRQVRYGVVVSPVQPLKLAAWMRLNSIGGDRLSISAGTPVERERFGRFGLDQLERTDCDDHSTITHFAACSASWIPRRTGDRRDGAVPPHAVPASTSRRPALWPSLCLGSRS